MSANKKQYPQPYRYEIAKAKYLKAGGKFTLEAPEGLDEASINLMSEMLEIFVDVRAVEENLKGVVGHE